MKPTIGRIVHYTMSEYDAKAINTLNRLGNVVRDGDVYPAVVVRVFDPSVSTANLQVLLDGTDTYWATSRTEGDESGHWKWPERAA